MITSYKFNVVSVKPRNWKLRFQFAEEKNFEAEPTGNKSDRDDFPNKLPKLPANRAKSLKE